MYSNICELLAENNMITFCFIYDVLDNEIIAQEGDLKNRLIAQMSNYSDITKENIVSKTMKWESNIIINSFEKKKYFNFL